MSVCPSCEWSWQAGHILSLQVSYSMQSPLFILHGSCRTSVFTRNLSLKRPPPSRQRQSRPSRAWSTAPLPKSPSLSPCIFFYREPNRLMKKREMFESWAGCGGRCCPHISSVTHSVYRSMLTCLLPLPPEGTGLSLSATGLSQYAFINMIPINISVPHINS